MVYVKMVNRFSRIIYMKMEFSSREEKCFVPNHQHGRLDVMCKPVIPANHIGSNVREMSPRSSRQAAEIEPK